MSEPARVFDAARLQKAIKNAIARYSGANGTKISDRRASAIGRRPPPQCRLATLTAKWAEKKTSSRPARRRERRERRAQRYLATFSSLRDPKKWPERFSDP